jgi:hypothetical protein
MRLRATYVIGAILLTVVPLGAAHAEGNCPTIEFGSDIPSRIIEGVAPTENRLCYRLETQAGQQVRLQILQGDNVVFTVPNVVEGDDHVSFSATRDHYDISVMQLMRSSGPEPFKLSVQLSPTDANAVQPDQAAPDADTGSDAGDDSGDAGAAEADSGLDLSAALPPVVVAHDPERVSTELRAIVDQPMLSLGCNKALGPGIAATLNGYGGDRLPRDDGQEFPVTFVVTRQSGEKQPFPTKMRYSEARDAFVSDMLPANFVESFFGGGTLVLQDGSGNQVLRFGLTGAQQFSRKAIQLCGS